MTKTDAAKLPVMLTSLRLPSIARLWQDLGARADREGWGAARYLATLCEHEVQERHTRRIARHLAEADLPTGKTLHSFEFAMDPPAHAVVLSIDEKSQIQALERTRPDRPLAPGQ